MNRYRGIGLMSGTSLDGVDLAFCSFTEKPDGSWKHEFLNTKTIPYPEKWKNRLATIQNASAETYARTDSGYGKFLGSILTKFIAENRIEPEFIASHGHTIFHQPEIEFTAQIGKGETIAAHLPCPLVTDFRT